LTLALLSSLQSRATYHVILGSKEEGREGIQGNEKEQQEFWQVQVGGIA
jgi:hypothetical protein